MNDEESKLKSIIYDVVTINGWANTQEAGELLSEQIMDAIWEYLKDES